MSEPLNCDGITLDDIEFKPVRKRRPVYAVQMHGEFQVTILRSMATGGRRGDYLMIGKPGDYLLIRMNGEKDIIGREVFEANWVEIKHDIARVQAVYDDGIGFLITGLPGHRFIVTVGDAKDSIKGADTLREALAALVKLADKHYPECEGRDV